MTDREAFEADYFGDLPLTVAARERSGGGYKYAVPQSAWTIWQAAVKNERERCAKVCTDIWHELCDDDAGIEASVAVADCAYLIRARSEEQK